MTTPYGEDLNGMPNISMTMVATLVLMEVHAPSPPTSAEDFLVAFETLAQAVRRARGAMAQDTAGRLTLSQYSLLLPLSGSDTARVSASPPRRPAASSTRSSAARSSTVPGRWRTGAG
jgi:hypothetical protein